MQTREQLINHITDLLDVLCKSIDKVARSLGEDAVQNARLLALEPDDTSLADLLVWRMLKGIVHQLTQKMLRGTSQELDTSDDEYNALVQTLLANILVKRREAIETVLQLPGIYPILLEDNIAEVRDYIRQHPYGISASEDGHRYRFIDGDGDGDGNGNGA